MDIQQTSDRHFAVGVSEGNIMQSFPEGETVVVPVDRICVIIIDRGDAEVEIDGACYGLRAGTVMYLLPNRLLRLRSHSVHLRTLYVRMTYELLSDFPLLLKADISEYIGNHPCRGLSERECQVLAMYHNLLMDRYHSGEVGMEVVKGVLYSFVMEVNRLCSGKSTDVQVTHQDKMVDSFFRLLHRHFIEERSAAFYADALCVSDKHLMRVIKHKTGRSFHSWLTDFLMRQARLVLLSTDMNVTQVSDSLHFPNSSAFAKFFRKGEGMSPLEYRKKCRGSLSEDVCHRE